MLRILFEVDKSKICTSQPYGCTGSYTLVVDSTILDDKDDLKCDDLGVWHHNGVSTQYFDVEFEGQNVRDHTIGKQASCSHASMCVCSKALLLEAQKQ